MNRHKGTLTAVALTAAAVITLGGCGDGKKPATVAPGRHPASTSLTRPQPQNPPTYVMPANLCTAVNADAFADLAPAARPKATEVDRTHTTRRITSTCMVAVGTFDNPIVVSVGLDLFADPFGAQGQYEGFRSVSFNDFPGARDVAGVGAAAYIYSDPQLGPHLVAWFGNAHIAVWAVQVHRSAPLPSDMQDRLVKTIQATLSTLPTA